MGSAPLDVGSVIFGILSFFLGIALGVWLGVWYAEYIRRPQLRFTGGGSARVPFRRDTFTITNEPGWIGVAIGESTILGRRLHSGIRRGLVVDRHPAKQCHAHLIDKAKARPITGLYWHSPDDGDRYESAPTIPGGESRSLMLFAALPSEPTTYFAFEPDASSPFGIRVPEEHVRYTGEHEFEVHINYANGRTLTADVAVTLDYQGNLHVEQRHKGGGRSSSLF